MTWSLGEKIEKDLDTLSQKIIIYAYNKISYKRQSRQYNVSTNIVKCAARW